MILGLLYFLFILFIIKQKSKIENDVPNLDKIDFDWYKLK